MSLINDMLRDLDRRRASLDKSNESILHGLHAVSATTTTMGRQHYWLIAVVVVVVCVGIGLRIGSLWQAQSGVVTSTLAPLAQQALQTAPVEDELLTSQPVIDEAQLASEQPAVAMAQAAGTLHKEPIALTAEERMQERFDAAIAMVEQGDVPLAEKAFRQILSDNPLQHKARQTLVSVLVRQDKIAQAMAVLQEGMQIAPGYSQFTVMLAHLLVEKNDYAGALKTLINLHPSMMQEPDYYAFEASLYEHLGQFDEAAKLYASLLQLQPENATWWLGLGISLEGSGHPKEALQAYQHAQLDDNLQPQLHNYIRERITILEG
jgi:MSHA biogenesis protein MshN